MVDAEIMVSLLLGDREWIRVGLVPADAIHACPRSVFLKEISPAWGPDVIPWPSKVTVMK